MVATLDKPKRSRRRTLAPKRWRRILCAIPGYDPFRDAEDCFFEPEAAEYYIEFIETCCTHIEGQLAGVPFLLEDWEKAIVANLFGWYRTDALGRIVRRYRKGFIYVPRKNGKTPLVAAIHNAVLFDSHCTPEAGQINNLAAASRDQASKLFRHIVGMIRNEPEMEKRCQIFATTRSVTKPDNSVTKVIPADENVAHGDNPHLQVVEELHAQPSPKLYEALVSAMSSANRLNGLLLLVTTADFSRPSICNTEYDYAVKVRDGIVSDPSYLPVIYEAMHLDAEGRWVEDDWTREDTWYKANPNLGVSKSIDYMREACLRAKEDPAFENTFKRLDLNIRTEQATRIISMSAWDANDAALIYEPKQACWAALDIGASRDLCAFVMLFRDAGEGEPVTVQYEDNRGQKQQYTFQRFTYNIVPTLWMPENAVSRDSRMERQLQVWIAQGLIHITPGNVVDYDQVGIDIAGIVEPYALQQLAVDQGFQGMQITQDLQKIFGAERVVAFRQGILSMAAPCRELLELIGAGRLRHGGHPVLRWMASNVAAEQRQGLIKFSKDKSTEKIDAMTALAMALGIAMAAKEPTESVYEKRGIRTIG